MKCLRISRWSEIFENNRTRELKSLSWIPFPNKMDGDGFTEIMDHKDGMIHFAAWVLIAQVASKCDPRGTLLRDCRTPHTSKSIARMTRASEQAIIAAIPRLISVGWLEEFELQSSLNPTVCNDPESSCDNPALACGDAAPCPDPSILFSTVPFSSSSGGTGGAFKPPTLDEVLSVALESKVSDGIARDFFDYYESNGWMVGKAKMKKWKSAFSRWSRNNQTGNYGNSHGNGNHRQPSTTKSIVDERNSRIVGAESTKRAILAECENPGPQPWDVLR